LLALNAASYQVSGGTVDGPLPGQLSSLGGPLYVGDNGRTLWLGAYGTPAYSTLFLDEVPLVSGGSSQLDGQLVKSIGPGSTIGYCLSDNGRYALVRIQLLDNSIHLYRLDLAGDAIELPGCSPTGASLASTAAVQTGASLTLEVDGGQAPGAQPFLLLSLGAAPGSPPCGDTSASYSGELLIDASAAKLILLEPLAAWTGTPVAWSVAVSPSPALVGLELWGQSLFIDASGSTPAEPLRLSNGLYLTLGS
jgi:hypothetical protein